jgi:DNA-binding helix-hairpin-helix protein with protein kinase domain
VPAVEDRAREDVVTEAVRARNIVTEVEVERVRAVGDVLGQLRVHELV